MRCNGGGVRTCCSGSWSVLKEREPLLVQPSLLAQQLGLQRHRNYEVLRVDRGSSRLRLPAQHTPSHTQSRTTHHMPADPRHAHVVAAHARVHKAARAGGVGGVGGVAEPLQTPSHRSSASHTHTLQHRDSQTHRPVRETHTSGPRTRRLGVLTMGFSWPRRILATSRAAVMMLVM